MSSECSDKQQPTPRTAAVDFAEYQHQSDYMVALRNLARQLERETLAWGAAVFKACGNRHTSTPDEVDAAVAAHVKHHVEGAAIPSSTAFVPEGERKSLAGQAIEMAISALRDIQRRAPGTRTFFDYEAFIERELVPAMAMADKDRQGCIGLMGLLAKEKLKVEELSKPVSAIERSCWKEVDGYQGVLGYTGRVDAVKVQPEGGAVFCILADGRFFAYDVPPLSQFDIKHTGENHG